MADVVVLLNPLDVSRRRRLVLPDDIPLLAWVDANEPALGALQRCVFVNGQACEDRTYRTHAHDEVLVTFAPGITGAMVTQAIVSAIVAAAIGYIVSRIFAPSRPKAADTPQASQVYGIAPPKNAARLGQPIPVIYGNVIALPDFAAQPYTFYLGNEAYLHAILCLGLGEFDVVEMMLGQTSAVPLAKDVVQYRVFLPADHNKTFGVIEAATGVRENVVTSPAVGDQELVAPNAGGSIVPSTWYWALSAPYQDYLPHGLDISTGTLAEKLVKLPQNPALGIAVLCTYGYYWNYYNPNGGWIYRIGTYTATAYDPTHDTPPDSLVPPPGYSEAGKDKWVGSFATCKPGQHGSLLELDFVFQGGLYKGDSSGNLTDATVAIKAEAQQIDDDGKDIVGALLTFTPSFTAHDNTPQRRTVSYPVPSGRYRVRAQRTSASDLKVTTSDHVIWAGLKFQLDPPPPATFVYGDVTLISIIMKATNGVAADAAGSMRFRATRRLRPIADPNAPTQPTTNPADAFADVLCAAYGGARPVNDDELDLVELLESREMWEDHDGFNAVFDQPSTVWEALGLTVQTVHAAPLPVGSRMSLIHDGVQPVRTQLFTDANIAAGSLQVNVQFDTTGTPQGVRVNYRDALSFSAQALLLPPDAPDFTTVDLFGCTSPTVAQEHGTLIQAKRRLQRMAITFVTELEGLNVLPGDRIGVQSGMVKWAQSARVASWDGGLVVDLDTALDWTTGSTHAIQLRDPTGAPVRVVGVTRGETDAQLILPSAAPFELVELYSTLEATILSFGAVDQETTDWTVTKMTPNGAQVTIDALNYDPAIYAGAAAFTRAPIGLAEAGRFADDAGELLEEAAP
jgi:hypothetical protein